MLLWVPQMLLRRALLSCLLLGRGQHRGVRHGVTGPFGGGGVVAKPPLRHTRNCREGRDRGVATPWSAAGGGCSVCAT